MMTPHLYSTKSQIIDENGDTFSSTSSVATFENIVSLETKLLSRFDELSNELLNVKDVINKTLKSENERPREKFSNLENKVISLEASQNMLEHYDRKNNIEISGIPDSVEENSFQKNVVSVLSNIVVAVISNYIEAYHRNGYHKTETIKKNGCSIY